MDGGGLPDLSGPDPGQSSLMEERWPDIEFRATREHYVASRAVSTACRSSRASYPQSRRLVFGRVALARRCLRIHRNLVKFHLMRSCPGRPGPAAFRCLNSGSARSPLTSILPNMGKADAVVELAELRDLVVAAGILFAELVAGKAEDFQPLSWYFSYISSRPANCGVKPHLDAVLTTSRTLPLKSLRVFPAAGVWQLKS